MDQRSIIGTRGTGHKSEGARLEKLRSLEILDTPPERTFDRIVRLAARVFSAPIAAVSFVDEHRQWHKASRGLPGCKESFRETSFCTHAILSDEVMVVTDARQDARLAHFPIVSGEGGVRFYAGAPLKTEDGYRLGTLCIMDRLPRAFSKADRKVLADLAAIVIDELTLRQFAGRLHAEVKGRKRNERSLAKQHRLLRRLSSSLEDGIEQRTEELTRLNDSLRAEISQRKRIDRDRLNLLGLVEESPDFIGLATMEAVPQYVNEAGRRLVGLDSLEEALRTPFIDYFRPEDQAFVRDTVLRSLREIGQWEGDIQFRHFKTGALIPVSWNLFYVRDPVTGAPVSMAAIARDITERHRAEAALKQAKEEAEKANAAKSEFLSRMSHELRTPLNAILGFGQILLAQSADAAQADCAAQVVNAGNHLLGLINEVLDIARIETGRVQLSVEPIRVSSLVAETLDLIRPQAHERGITIEVSLDDCANAYLLADRQRGKQVLLNLLSNAVKYSPRGGRVRVGCERRRPRELRINVSDAGPGIALDKIARLFVAFERLGAERTAVPGTGLGLTLSKHLAEAMGGSIGVKSVPGEGSTFWLQLPRPRGAVHPGRAPLPLLSALSLKADPGPADAGPGGGVDCTVLCIEDNASNLSLIEHLFSRLPQVRLLTARSGGESLKLARREQPHLVLLDLHLPDMPGREVLVQLRAGRRTRGIPVVAVSADATPGTVERLIKDGARAYLTKPLNIDTFYQLLPSLGLHRETGVPPADLALN